VKLLVAAILVCACKQDPTSTAAAAPAPTKAKPPAVVVDADETFALLEHESIGGLKQMAEEKAVIALLGPPTKKAKAVLEGATGDYASDWQWSTATIDMVAEKKSGPWKARLITISKTSKLETAQHIHIGSTRAELEKAYKRSEDDDKSKPNQYLAGSMYGGMLFELEHDKVSSISMGPFAF
jgi:hypothetical protein